MNTPWSSDVPATTTSSPSLTRPYRPFSSGIHDEERRPVSAESCRLKIDQAVVETTNHAANGSETYSAALGASRK